VPGYQYSAARAPGAVLGLRRDSAQSKQLLLASTQDEPIAARGALQVFVS
jgi:hypothetical protein